MNFSEPILQTAVRTIEMEAEAIKKLSSQLEGFEHAVDILSSAKGRIVVSGIGKSAIIAQKLVATFNSTGTPSIFLHAADAIHGDLGMVQQDDVVMIISKSGESPEIKVLITLIKNFGNPVIAIVGNTSSTLAKKATCFLNTTVDQEACPNNLAPTTSTTAQLVMGDAIAICLMEKKGFQQGDFAKLHPGGTLGKKLYLRVGDLSSENEKPQVKHNQSLREIIVEMTEKRLGVAVVTDEEDAILGIITDGDIRRMLEKDEDVRSVLAKDIMSTAPKTIEATELAVTALDIMRQHQIMHLVVLQNDKYAGIIHLHDIVKEGLI